MENQHARRQSLLENAGLLIRSHPRSNRSCPQVVQVVKTLEGVEVDYSVNLDTSPIDLTDYYGSYSALRVHKPLFMRHVTQSIQMAGSRPPTPNTERSWMHRALHRIKIH